MFPPKAPVFVSVSPVDALRAPVVKHILKAIFTGEIRGSDRLVEQELAKKLGVSRTPVREALFELAAVGVIRLRPKLGVTVRDFGATQIREIYQIRRLLECEATRLCAGRIDEALLRQIRDETQARLAAQDP